MGAAREMNWTPPPEEVAQDLRGLVGEIVAGRFRVLGVAHAGRNGVVYEVEPPSVGHQRRALKLLDVPEARDAQAVARLRACVEATRGLENPYLERLYEVGELPDTTPYVLTEWIDAGTLGKVLEGGEPVPVDATLAVIRAVADALAALHGRGVVHGDVRPSSVLCAHGSFGFSDVRLVGAGIASALGVGPAGGASGDVAYISPECIMGDPATPATDVYALGVLAYRLLTGRLPYTADDARADAAGPDPIARVQWLHLNVSPVRPSKVVPDAGVARGLEQALALAMSKRPERRPPNARAFLIALERALTAPPPKDAAEPAEPPVEFEPPQRGAAPAAQVEAPAVEWEQARRRWPWVLTGASIGAVAAWVQSLLI